MDLSSSGKCSQCLEATYAHSFDQRICKAGNAHGGMTIYGQGIPNVSMVARASMHKQEACA